MRSSSGQDGTSSQHPYSQMFVPKKQQQKANRQPEANEESKGPPAGESLAKKDTQPLKLLVLADNAATFYRVESGATTTLK